MSSTTADRRRPGAPPGRGRDGIQGLSGWQIQWRVVDALVYRELRTRVSEVRGGFLGVLLQPLGRRGLVILGGWAPRCFSSSDERWLEGWAERLRTQWLEAIPGGAEGEEPEGSGEREEPAAPSSPADRVPPP